MAIFRGRRFRIQVADLQIETPASGEGLHVEFDVVRTLDRLPNSATFKIYNLSAEHRRQVDGLKNTDRCALWLGYRTGELFEVFRGEVRFGFTSRADADLVTTVDAQDGKTSNVRVQRSYAKGTKLSKVLRDLQAMSGMGPGNMDEMIAREPALSSATLEAGITLQGEAGRLLDEALGPHGVGASVQSGVVQLTGKQGLPQTAALLTPGSGLLGSPNVSLDQNSKRIVSCEARIMPGLEPGRQVRIESESTTGTFVITRTQYSGSIDGANFSASIEANPF